MLYEIKCIGRQGFPKFLDLCDLFLRSSFLSNTKSDKDTISKIYFAFIDEALVFGISLGMYGLKRESFNN